MTMRGAKARATVTVLFLSGWLVCGAWAADDYLTPELRYRVERLKTALADAPTSAETLGERNDVLWSWANAYALTGNPIPQDLPVIVRGARGLADAKAETIPERMKGLIEFYIWELTVKDEMPDGMPVLTLSMEGQVAARSWQTIEQTMTVGALSIAEGDSILLGRDGFNDHGVPQTTDPAGDNYLTIRSSNPDVRFAVGPGNNGVSLPSRIEVVFTLEGAPLEEGDTVTVTYGDRSGGSRGFLIQSYSVDEFALPIYVDFGNRGLGITGLTLDWPTLEVVGMAEVARVKAVAPSVVKTGEAFELAVRSEDVYYNRASGNVPAYTVSLNGQAVAQVSAGNKGLTVLPRCQIDRPGIYRFEIVSEDGAVSGRSNPVWVRDDPPFRIYWGDTHGHTKYAEGQGSPEGYYRFARDDARLDFVTLSEHDIWLDAYEWQTMKRLADSFWEEGRFIPILGYEWTVAPPQGGHHNVLFRDTDRSVVGSQVAPVLKRLYEALRLQYKPKDVLVIPHAHAPGDWTQSDGGLERLVEIASVHGTFEFFGNRYLQNGWQVGFIGSSDNHRQHPGYPDTNPNFHTERNGLAAVLAQEKTRDSLFSAMRDIKAYATSGDRIILDVRMNGELVGTRLAESDERRIACRVMGTAPIETIDVVKNGEVLFSREYAAAQPGSHCWVQIGFSSDSEVFRHRAPRNFRIWEGTLEVKGATLASFQPISFDNPHAERVEVDAQNPNLIHFRTQTRGRMDVLLLELEGAGDGTSIDIHVNPGRIGPGAGRRGRLPEADVSFSLGDAREGRLVHELLVPIPNSEQSNRDAITLQVFDPDAGLDQEFEFSDTSRYTPGDYYYVRATQIDGERAWSSPWWVGGEARNHPGV